MKNLYFKLILVLIFSTFVSGQITTFDKDYPQFGNSNGFIVEETDDAGFMLGGVTESGLLLIRTNGLGEVQFSKTFPRSNEFPDLRTFPVLITDDGGYIITSGIENGDLTDLNLLKLDPDGNTVWDRIYLDTLSTMGSDIVETDGGDFICVGSIERHIVKVVKTDSEGNLSWSRILTFTPTARILAGPSIIESADGNFVLASERFLQKITSDGDSLWRIDLGFKVTTVKQTRFGRMIAAGYRKFAVINLDGIVEYVQSLDFTVDAGDNTQDKGYVFLANGNKITKTDSLGMIEWEKDIIGEGNYIISTSEGGYAVTGNYSNAIRLLKTVESGTAASVFLLNQNNYTSLAIFHDFNIEWYSDGIENVNIEFSIDDGTNWLEVVSNYPADSGKYVWTVPNNPSNNCNLRISSSDNAEITDMLNTTFSIVLIQNSDYIAINEIKMFIGNDGTGSNNPLPNGSGFYWPGGADAEIGAILADGLIWGGKVDNKIGVNGSMYRGGLKPGKILENGQPDDPELPQYKIFKIRKDWESLPEGPIRDRLEYDYKNWPGDLGAPYIDVNGDGVFSKGIDTPEFLGDEVLFYVANDSDTASSRFTYGSDPSGLELQTTVFGFKRDDVLKNVVFKKYNIVNKSSNTIEDMYLSYWADNDLGYSGDDFVGCDTLLNLAYSYNADEYDEDLIEFDVKGYGTPPPALGHLLLQGPLGILSNGDSSWTGHMPVIGNLPMTAFSLYICGGGPFRCPGYGYDAALQIYNNMQGKSFEGEYYFDPVANDNTYYCLPGDPVNGSGWYEGAGWPNGPEDGDRYYLLTTGPFNFEPGASQEVMIATLMAIGEDNINSISKLKGTAKNTIDFYKSGFSPDFVTGINTSKQNTPTDFYLSQNYPNPFNPSTKIKYTIAHYTHPSIPSRAMPAGRQEGRERSDRGVSVKLVVYDILGREVTTLVNQKQKPGNYEVIFDAGKYPSGVYFYQLKSGDFVNVKKMMLIK